MKGSRKIKALAEIFEEKEQRRSAGAFGALGQNDGSEACCDAGFGAAPQSFSRRGKDADRARRSEPGLASKLRLCTTA